MKYGLLIFGLVAAPLTAAGPVGPNAGPMLGEGSLSDSDGNTGNWAVEAVLRDGNFEGSGRAVIGDAVVEGPLTKSASYLENGKCYFKFEQGRNRVEIGGPCTTTSIEGRLGGFVAGDSKVGTIKGSLAFGASGEAAPATAGILPTAKLSCAWMERMGGNVAGDLPNYELRISNMVTLTLASDGSYKTNKASGRFLREGDSIRLTSGAFAGARGRLERDRSGEPAVYFDIDDNRGPDGVHIVDPARTSCTRPR
ncbi:hypothetical protein [Sphingosinicella humi]|uniref:Uncharacterized protein n=1 Tax=Allosphingosinicella humi TaxID=2068657 RepID=A0A2U2J042_9SPHN|nr:hypothetical protein [Sphingosinicella humi]PWG01709.1 hypothetical protein DF286_01630 [Sphingosinicella humi]